MASIRLALTILAGVVTGISSAKVDLSIPRGRAAASSATNEDADASATHASLFSSLSALHSGVLAALDHAERFEKLATPLLSTGGLFSSNDAPSLLHDTRDALSDTANVSAALARATLRILGLLDPVAAARLVPPVSASATSAPTASSAVPKSDDATNAKRKRASPGASKDASRAQQPAVAPGALTEAARTNASAEVIEGLLARGADVHEVDETGLTALHFAAGNGNAASALLLLDADAGVVVTDDAGRTPLHWAAFQGRAGTVRVLLDAGASVAFRDRHGWPPLHVAAFYGHAEAAEALLDGGADHSMADPAGVTALALARDQRRPTVEAALRAAGAR